MGSPMQHSPPGAPPRWWTRRWLLAVPLLLLGLFLMQPPDRAQAVVPTDAAHLLTIDGVISPTTARYLERELRRAAEQDARLVILRLDTPGGLERSMRDMTTAVLGSPVPVVVWVGPSGARAASAGMFVTVAAHVAAMAPGTSIGAAHPVSIGGEHAGEAAADKVTADAAAFARSLAAVRGRNGDWVEAAVVASVAASAEEALQLGVIDLVAADPPALLAALQGRTVETPDGPDRLTTDGLQIVERPMALTEQVLQALTDPNVAYLLFTLGIVGLVAELYAPGTLFPGLTGVISLVLAFVAFGSLPVSGAGLVLLVLGLGLFVADLYTEGLGVLAVGGLVAFVVGSLMLYQPLTPPSPALPEVAVAPWLVAGVSAVVTGFFLIVARALVRSHREPVASGTEALEGKRGVALTELDPMGQVQIEGETWTATADHPVPRGSTVEVLGLRGVTLQVRPV